MKQLFFLIAIFSLAISTVSCKAKKEATTTTSETTPTTTAMTETKEHTYRFIISFISKGTGVDRNNVEALLKYVEAQPKKPEYEKIQWGREGEMDFCFQLNELKKDEQAKFIKDVKNQMAGSDRVFMTENMACTHQRRQ